MKKIALVLIAFLFIISGCEWMNKKQIEDDKADVYVELIKAIKNDDRNSFDKYIKQVSEIDSFIQIDKDDYSYTLLGYACKYKRFDLAEKLIKLGADIDIGQSNEYLVFDALSVAVESQDIDLVELLLKSGANPNRLNSEEGFTVLSLSCKLGNYEISKLLIENGAKVDGIGDTGFDYIHYPLLYAVESNKIELVQLLIDNNCTIDVRNKQDETAFTIAEQNENQQIMNLLIKNLPHSEREVKYYFRANGGSVLFFDDGTAFRCARCELSNNLDSYEPNITYKEFPNYLLMEGGIKWELYDRYGDIAADWVIVNYQKYKNIDSFYENQTDNSAVKMLREFYTQYITQNAKVDGYDHNVIIAIQNSYLSKDLLKKLKEAELDYLPFLNAQDCELDWLETLEIVPQNNDGNSYKVCFYYQDNLRKCITLFLVENNGKYLIDDLEKL